MHSYNVPFLTEGFLSYFCLDKQPLVSLLGCNGLHTPQQQWLFSSRHHSQKHSCAFPREPGACQSSVYPRAVGFLSSGESEVSSLLPVATNLSLLLN